MTGIHKFNPSNDLKLKHVQFDSTVVDTKERGTKATGDAQKSDIYVSGAENDTREDAYNKAKKLNPKANERAVILWGPKDDRQFEFLVADENGNLESVSYEEWRLTPSTGESRHC